MKLHFVIAGCLGLVMWSGAAHGQNLIWAKQFGGTSDDSGQSIAVDASGNVYTIGNFYGTIDVDPGPGIVNLSSVGDRDMFIIRQGVFGNLVWAVRLGGTGGDYGSSITVDNSGNIYATGGFQGTVDFDPGPGTFNLTAVTGPNSGGYAVKFDSSGNLVWAKQLGGNPFGSAVGLSIAVDLSGSIFIMGNFEGAGDMDPGPGNLYFNSFSYSDIFIIKLQPSGNLVWAKQLGGTGHESGTSMAVDAAGNVYATGLFDGTVDFNPGAGTFNLSSAGCWDIFIIALNISGNLVWAKRVGGTDCDQGSDIALDVSGNIYASGMFSDTLFVPGPGPIYLASASDAFITKLDVSGNILWFKQLGGTSNDRCTAITIDASGNLLAAGWFSETVDFNPDSGILNLTSSGYTDVFILKVDTSGNLIWANKFGGTLEDFANSMTIDGDGKIYTAGSFNGTADFDPGIGTFYIASAGGSDAFVSGLAQTMPYAVEGKIFGDVNTNCNHDTLDVTLLNVLIKAEPGPFYGISNTSGNYIIHLFDTGNYVISVATQDTLWQTTCTTSYNIQLTGSSDIANRIDFSMTAALYCPRLTVELGIPLLRRCFNNTYSISYANTGTLPASNVYIEIDFGNSLQPQSSTLPWSAVSGNVYTFPIGNLSINQQGSFNVTALLDCNAQLGSTQCVTAHIYPDSVCVAPSTGWDKSETKVTGTCVNDSLVCFKIKNRSSPPSGNMQGSAPWRLFVNDTLVTQGSYQLAGQDSLIQCYPANGKTYRLEADQRLGHPSNSHPQAIVEACGNGPVDFGFVTTVAQDDADLFVETFCMTVIGSYDPNDKQVFPTGITANKYIKPDDELEYLIRFQNTGNDTAFKIVIRDTIQIDVIDIATLTSGASSHDYTFNIYGHGIAEWTFNNILLPDSNVNEPESHGFVKFKAKLLPNITPGTVVTNSADIYFDFNAPVITHEVWNTVYDTVLRAPVIISGTVLTETNTPVPGVTVKLAGSATDSVITAADGRYDFEVEPGGSYTITPSKNNDAIPGKGLTTYDILTMRRHLLGMGALPSPYKIISAAEVNAAADTSITTQDIVLIRSLILGNTTSFPGSRLWQFVSSDYLFNDTEHPFPFSKTRIYTNLITPQLNQNFISIKLGDVNESWEE